MDSKDTFENMFFDFWTDNCAFRFELLKKCSIKQKKLFINVTKKKKLFIPLNV
jgi:hypothetical protein